MDPAQYTYCKDNIKQVTNGTNDVLALYCGNVLSSYQAVNSNPVISAQNYTCQYVTSSGTIAYTDVGVKEFAKQYGKIPIITAANRNQVSTAFVPAITVCNQNLY
jgi:hypothetical protein